MKRRTAIKNIGALGAATTLPAGWLTNLSTEQPLGIALVGLGNYATHQLAPALQHTQHCQLTGIVTGTPAKEPKWQEQYGIKKANTYNYKNFDRIRDNDEIDIVYIVLPNFMHAEYTIRALEAGKHVICEKPMGMNAQECKMMLDAQNRSGKLLQIGYRLYYEPTHLAAQQAGQAGRLGALKTMESSLGFRMGRPGIWRIDPEKGGGGAIMDLGVYCIQAARRMANQLPVSVFARGFTEETELYKGIHETMLFQLEFPNGAISNTTTSFSSYVDRFHAAFTDGWLEVKPAFNAWQQLGFESSKDLGITPPKLFYQQIAQMDAFAQNIRQGTSVSASGEEGYIDMQIIDAIKQSEREKRVVNIEYQ